ncbi:hypothetical protein FHS85_001905 [Rhodoligotrophos appendicifer]
MSATARILLNTAAFLLVGLGLGYFTVDMAVTRGFSPIVRSNGPWSVWTAASSIDADPYTRAHFASFGKLGMNEFEAMDFRAEEDSAGSALSQSCTYVLTGAPLAGRWWNIVVYQIDRSLIPNKADRHSFNSENVIREPNGSVRIALSPQPQSGNWLPLGTGGGFRLVLSIIDPPQNYRANPSTIPLPRIERKSC